MEGSFNGKNIFLYWSGKEFSLIKILRKLIYLHSNEGRNYTVNLITDENVKEYIQIPENFYSNRVEHRADYIRVKVVLKYGGIWLDSDTLVMSDLSELFKILEIKDGFFIREENIKICNGVFGANANSEIMKMWSDKVEEAISSKANKEWTTFGSKILNQKPFLEEIAKKSKVFDGLDTMYPAGWKECPRLFLGKGEDLQKKLQKEFQPLIILVNSVYRELENKTEKEIIEMSTPLSFFIKKSLGTHLNLEYI